MTSPAQPATPRPTLFISYASEDRAAVRKLRDALESAGLDVWYDENELGGGDAWDQKIRRQIRDCDFFMPVISASTERRKEGYFRREWRLATERTLDMADDVMFLLPVCIDDTTENNARVPEKFLAVQWLRLAGGEPTAALIGLAQRLAAGEHMLPTPSRGRQAPPPLSPGSGRAAAPHHAFPPMPPFPHLHGKGFAAGLRFLAEAAWWLVAAVWQLLRHGPRWIRVLLSVWLCLSIISMCSRSRSTEPGGDAPRTKKAAQAAETKADLAKATQALQQSGLPVEWKQVGTELAARLAAELKDSEASDKQIIAVPFASGVTDAADAKFLADVFTPLWGRLAIERSGNTGLISTPLAAPADSTLLALGRKLDAQYVLGARLVRPAAPEGGAPGEAVLQVVLLKSEGGATAWSDSFPVKGADSTALAARIGDAVLAVTATK